MIYLNNFKISSHKIPRTNAYPYCAFTDKDCGYLNFSPITIFYGNNASGKSTLLNVIANKLQMKGAETIRGDDLDYWKLFLKECCYTLGDQESGRQFSHIPEKSRYIKSEDMMYEVKKIQEDAVLRESHLTQKAVAGMAQSDLEKYSQSAACKEKLATIRFCIEKYSNGEAVFQILDDSIYADSLYLLDEPEMSLSPQNQVVLAEKINQWSRYLSCQFIIATHSPFLLGTLDAKIYNLDTKDFRECSWEELGNVRFYYEFFKKHEAKFIK